MAEPMRVSVTALDQFLWFLRSPQTPESFRESLLEPWSTSPAMQRGTDFHDDLEDLHLGIGDMGDWIDHRSPDIDLIRCHALEVKVGRLVQTDGEPVYLSGQADGLSGITIVENKTTSGIKSDLRLHGDRVGHPYLDSWQWRSYLTMEEFQDMQRVRYEVFQLDRQDMIRAYMPFDCWRYPDVTDEVDAFVRRYVDYLRNEEEQGRMNLGVRGPVRRTLEEQGKHDPDSVMWHQTIAGKTPWRMKTWHERKK